MTAPHWPHASSLLAYPEPCADRRFRARRSSFGIEKEWGGWGGDVGPVEGHQLAGRGARGGGGGLSPPGVYF